jgi:hypothetical protein
VSCLCRAEVKWTRCFVVLLYLADDVCDGIMLIGAVMATVFERSNIRISLLRRL